MKLLNAYRTLKILNALRKDTTSVSYKDIKRVCKERGIPTSSVYKNLRDFEKEGLVYIESLVLPINVVLKERFNSFSYEVADLVTGYNQVWGGVEYNKVIRQVRDL